MDKIAVLIGSADISGGTYVIFQHAWYLQNSGIDITILTEEPVPPEVPLWHDKGGTFKFKTIDEASNESFDLAIATWWVTVYKLHRVNAGKYAFFNQSVESRFYLENDYATRKWADGVYLFNLPVITEASWIQKYLEHHFNRDSQLVLNGIRKDIYSAEGEAYAPREAGKLRVLIEGPLGIFFKNTEKAISLSRQSNADEIWFLTASKGAGNIEGVDRVFSCIKNIDTPKIYRSCDVLVKLSYVEGMFGPPLEMFHCGGTSIVYDVTGHEEYIKHDQNAIVCNVDDENSVVENLNRLKNEPDYLSKLKSGALKEASEWPNWDESSKNFLEKVKNIKNIPCDSRREIEVKSNFLTDWSGKHLQVQIAHGEQFERAEKLQKELNLSRQRENMILESRSYKAVSKLRHLLGRQ